MSLTKQIGSVVLLVTALVTFFTRTSLRTVESLRPETFAEPVQTPVTSSNAIVFVRDGYRFEATPVFDYRISGLVVRKLNYSWFVIDRSEKAFPVDLCIVWGENAQRKLYHDPTVRFSQDCRFCFAQWGGDVPFRMDQLSNNHLLVSDRALEKKLKSIMTSDQVTIRGELVNVKGQLLGKAEQYDSESTNWKTSTTRTDTGPGACEVIYVEDVEILQRGNELSRRLFAGSLVGLGIMVAWSVVRLFQE